MMGRKNGLYAVFLFSRKNRIVIGYILEQTANQFYEKYPATFLQKAGSETKLELFISYLLYENISLIVSFRLLDKGYFFSWRDPALRGVEEDWLSARNYCRQRCMDLVSLETSDENEWVKARIVQDKVIH